MARAKKKQKKPLSERVVRILPNDASRILMKWLDAVNLLEEAAEHLCAEDPEQGNYCRCGAYVGRGESHRRGCLYVRIKSFLEKRGILSLTSSSREELPGQHLPKLR